MIRYSTSVLVEIVEGRGANIAVEYVVDERLVGGGDVRVDRRPFGIGVSQGYVIVETFVGTP
jgi:hypothetical protein